MSNIIYHSAPVLYAEINLDPVAAGDTEESDNIDKTNSRQNGRRTDTPNR